MNEKLKVLISDVMLETPGSVETEVYHQLVHFVSEFCRRTKCWEVVAHADARACEPITQIKGVSDAVVLSCPYFAYDKDVPGSYLINEAYRPPCCGAESGIGAGTTGGPINVTTCGTLSSNIIIPRPYYNVSIHGSVEIIPPYIPVADVDNAFKAKLFLYPSLHGEYFPDDIIEENAHLIINGTVAKMTRMPKRPYTDLNLSQIKEAEFNKGLVWFVNRLDRRRTGGNVGVMG